VRDVWKEAHTEHGTSRPMVENVVDSPIGKYRPEHNRFQLVVLAVAVASAAAVVGWLLVRSQTRPATPATSSGVPAIVSRKQLEGLARLLDQPVFWAGPREGFSYELTTTKDRRVFVRYLPHGVAAGDPRARYLAIGTYASPHAFADLKRATKRHDSISVRLDGGGLVVFAASRPRNVYFGYPDAKYQVEVFDPSGDTARRLVLSGTILPIR
jgi:hypothetical protein